MWKGRHFYGRSRAALRLTTPLPMYNSFLCIAKHIAVNFFLCNKVRKIKPPCNPEKWTLGELILTAFNNTLSRFSGTIKSNKNFIPTITVHHFMWNLHSLPYLYWHYKLVFAAHWCFWFSANDSFIEQVCTALVCTMCKEALLPNR